MVDIYALARAVKAQEDEQIHETTARVLAAIQAAGALSLMPNPTLPRTGLLLMVHPDVYARVREASKNGEPK
jgi:hypothetical protein